MKSKVFRPRSYIFFALALVAALAAGKLALSPHTAVTPQTPRIVMALEANPGNLHPFYATDANSARISELIFDSLVSTDENLRFKPALAERWERVDERTYLFHLRKGVIFHDGRPFTSADVKFTYDSVLDPEYRSPMRGLLGPLTAVETPSLRSVLLRFQAPYAPFLETASLGIVAANSAAKQANPLKQLIGTGPFRLAEFVSGEEIVLRSNPDYWQGAPTIPRVVFRVVPDAIVRALEFKNGTVNLLQNDIEPDMLPWIERNTPASVIIREGTTFQYLGMNLEHPILRHREVRQALAHAIDRDTIIRHLLKGLATPATGLLTPSHWAYDAAVRQWDYQPQAAKALLDRAGFRDPDGDGPQPRFRLSYKTTTLDLRRRIAEALREQLAKVGVDLEVRTYEWGTFYRDIQNGNFHLYSLAWVGIRDPDFYFTVFHSHSAPPSGNNRGRYRNPEVDRLLEAGRKALEPEKRRGFYRAVQRILAVELPYIPLWWTKNVVVVDPALRGFLPYPDGSLRSLQEVTFTSNGPSA